MKCRSRLMAATAAFGILLVQLTGSATPIGAQPEGFPKPKLDAAVQKAAQIAVQGVAQPVDVVAVRASTGEVLAYTSQGGGLAPDDALIGRYPTGSTFKVVTTAALLERGLTPSSPATCPASVVFGGGEVKNFDGQAHPITTLEEAFAQSCNTAFAQLGEPLPGRAFATTATRLGVGISPHVDRKAFGGKVAVPKTSFDRAEVASDGGTTLVSPLALASMAATIASGRLHVPHFDGAAPKPHVRPFSRVVLDGLRSMLATAVTDGTASGQGLPDGTHAKTGTAELRGESTVYAWLVGYRGDVAFAVLVVGGNEGGPVAGPIAARFLSAVS